MLMETKHGPGNLRHPEQPSGLNELYTGNATPDPENRTGILEGLPVAPSKGRLGKLRTSCED